MTVVQVTINTDDLKGLKQNALEKYKLVVAIYKKMLSTLRLI